MGGTMFNRSKENKRILILGLGNVGFYLAKRLQHEEFAVTAIEMDSDRYRQADEALDIRCIKGEAMDITCWQEAGALSMGCVIAVTDNDAVNMMAAQVADRFGIPCKIARVRSLQFGMADSLMSEKDLKIDLLIHPEELVAQEIVQLIKLREGNEVLDIAEGKVQLIATRIDDDSPLANRKLKDIAQQFHDFPFRVVAIARGITTIIPSGNIEIEPHDQVFIIVGRSNLSQLMDIIGATRGRRQHIMIVGGGLVGTRVADLLQGSVGVKLLEIDENRAQELTHELNQVEILHGDGSNADVLTMAGVREVDTFISTTGENETNIMSSLLAKNMMEQNRNGGLRRKTKTVALVSKEDYQVLAATIGLDLALNKEVMAANEIMRYIRRNELISVAHLHGFDAEVIELIAAPGSPITRKPLFRLDPSFHGKILVGAYYRDDSWNIAVGDTHIRDKEMVIVVCQSMQLKEVRKLFTG